MAWTYAARIQLRDLERSMTGSAQDLTGIDTGWRSEALQEYSGGTGLRNILNERLWIHGKAQFTEGM